MTRLLIFATACAALAATCAQASNYNPRASERAARTWQAQAMNLAPQVPPSEALSPQGPTLVASQPVPDTRANRERFGQPLSRAGRMTAPIGD